MSEIHGFKHVILTRFNLGLYDRPGADEWMRHRMLYFRATRDSVLSQDAEFEWWISMDTRTPLRWINNIWTDYRIHLTPSHPKEFRGFGWTITTRLDNDDILLPGAIKAIQDAFVEEEMIIDIRYQQMFNGELYTSGRDKPNSPFLSLIENGVKKTCYARPHSKMIQDYPAKFASDEVLAYMVIHDRNLGNRITGKRVT
jgi:hypothetical protein